MLQHRSTIPFLIPNLEMAVTHVQNSSRRSCQTGSYSSIGMPESGGSSSMFKRHQVRLILPRRHHLSRQTKQVCTCREAHPGADVLVGPALDLSNPDSIRQASLSLTLQWSMPLQLLPVAASSKLSVSTLQEVCHQVSARSKTAAYPCKQCRGQLHARGIHRSRCGHLMPGESHFASASVTLLLLS